MYYLIKKINLDKWDTLINECYEKYVNLLNQLVITFEDKENELLEIIKKADEVHSSVFFNTMETSFKYSQPKTHEANFYIKIKNSYN